MKIFLAAAAASALLLAPVGAYAQRSTQTTESQQDLRQGVKAEKPTVKRQEILRSETNKDGNTNGSANGSTNAPAPR